MEKTDKLLSDALAEFKKQYPAITSADMQTFILGFLSAAKKLKSEPEVKLPDNFDAWDDQLLREGLCDKECRRYIYHTIFKPNAVATNKDF